MKKVQKCYTNRELSWLQFNERVLNEAGNPDVPLAERLTFVSIFQSNLDEFFMVRVGTLMVQMNSKEEICENKTGMSSGEQVCEILHRVNELEEKKTKIYEQLMGELEPKGIRIINFNKLSNEEGRLLEHYFDAHIAPFLSPLTDHIRVISIVGRYLEHSRIYRFGVGEGEKMYISSADFMTRNTLRRVEVAAPIHDSHIRERIRYMFTTMMADDVKGKVQTADGSYVDRHMNEVPVNSQEVFFADAYKE